MNDPIDLWHDYVRTRDAAILDRLLADDVVFESPVVFSPQRGKAITSIYLQSATTLLGADTFVYRNTWRAASSAVLEFDSVIDGITINGVDIVAWNDDLQITNFKVMVRPLQAVNILHKKMGELLEAARTSRH